MFLDWISPQFSIGNAKILWVNGPAGYGKTILCAKVVEHTLTVLDSPVAHYFFSSDSEKRGDPFSVLRSWISQIIEHNSDAFRIACERWDSHDGGAATRTDILDILKAIVRTVPNCTFIVDGLDECTWNPAELWKGGDSGSLVGFFKSLQEAVKQTRARIMILSRDEPTIRHAYYSIFVKYSNESSVEYTISPQDIYPDATAFSRSIVNLQLHNKSEAQRGDISLRMVDRSNGMFQWMKMLSDDLQGWMNMKRLHKLIDQAPTAIESLYNRNWNKILEMPESRRSRALAILRWAAFALRPLTIIEITEALLIVDNDDCEDLSLDELPDSVDDEYVQSGILGLCGSLIETRKSARTEDRSSMTVHLTHFSVKQFILCKNPTNGQLLQSNEQLRLSNEATQNNTLARLCLRYLNIRSVWQQPLLLESGSVPRAFLPYAADFWHRHVKMNGADKDSLMILIKTLFDSSNPNWDSWRTWFNSFGSGRPEMSKYGAVANALFYASLLGLRDVVMHLVDETRAEVSHVDSSHRMALLGACLNGHEAVAQFLLEQGADTVAANNDGWTALHAASENSHKAVARLLLEKGADAKAADKNGWTSLHLVSQNGHEAMARLLLEQGADSKAADKNGCASLHLA